MFSNLTSRGFFDRTNRDAKDDSTEVVVIPAPSEEDDVEEDTRPEESSFVSCKMLPMLDYNRPLSTSPEKPRVEEDTHHPVWRFSSCDLSNS